LNPNLLPVAACPPDWPATAPDLRGRVLLVLGANGGLGQAFARAAAAAGAELVLAGRRVAALELLYDELEASGAKVGLYPLNLAGAAPQDYAELADRLRAECGGLDGVVFASAHLRGLSSVEHTPAEDWLTALHVNLAAPLLLVQALLPLLRLRSDAAIVLAINGPQACGRAYWGGYGVAQAGLAQLAAILADELERTCVRVHGFDPGPMRTGLRQRVWFSEDPSTVPGPERAAHALAALVGADGGRWRGQLLRLEV
jgi:NAD(P)-dependent dehydrogenase (short-subunit alcohol dehydrogenase family)